MLLRIFLCFIFVCNGFYGEPYYVSEDESCETPDGKSGKCILPNDCKTIKDFTNKLTLLTKELQEKLNEYYYCGVREKAVKICCISEPIEFEKPDAPPPPPPDVTNHKNLYLLPKDCGEIGLVNKITSGENAALGEFPWMALLSYESSSGPKFECGGTIINDRYILTAAHCLVDTTIPLIGVRVGEYDLSTVVDCDKYHPNCFPPPQDLSIEKIIYPTNYNTTYQANDIALIRVSKLNFKPEHIQPICLPIADEIRNEEFDYSLVTGWGFLDPEGNRPNILQKVELRTRPLQKCIDSYKNQEELKITYKQLCIGGTDFKDSCTGDSGGPLHTPTYIDDANRYVQHGILSVGHTYCGTKGSPAIYTRVAYYMKWILDGLEP